MTSGEAGQGIVMACVMLYDPAANETVFPPGAAAAVLIIDWMEAALAPEEIE
jgi:hypothetical protein